MRTKFHHLGKTLNKIKDMSQNIKNKQLQPGK